MSRTEPGSGERAYRCRRCAETWYTAIPDAMERGWTCPGCGGPLERWRQGDRRVIPGTEPPPTSRYREP
jgi:DNA-directed RNA polymerase subunit RPC12/RpoP